MLLNFCNHLVSVVVGLNLLFYYFILTYKHLHLNNCKSLLCNTVYAHINFQKKKYKSTNNTGQKKEKEKAQAKQWVLPHQILYSTIDWAIASFYIVSRKF